MKLILAFLILIISPFSAFPQVSISNNNANADSSAMLDIQSNSRGILIPRMSSVQREAIFSPAQGLLVAPHMVSSYEKDGEAYLQVDNSAMTYMLVNAVKELHAENVKLKTAVLANTRLQNEVAELKSQMSGLLQRIDAN